MKKIFAQIVLIGVLAGCAPSPALLATPTATRSIIVSTASALAQAMSSAVAGEVIQLRGGTYNVPATGWQFTNGGVTLSNYPGEQAILYQPAMDRSLCRQPRLR